jgi:hypothetical protein
MKIKTLHIEKPSQQLLELVRKLQADKEARKKELRDSWDKYFPKK